MALRETACLRQLGGNRGGELQAGRFFAHPKLTAARIVAGWSGQTGTAAAGRHVLAIQDATAVSFATGAEVRSAMSGATRRGLGRLNEGTAHGLLAHVVLAVDADSRACLGLAGRAVWNRQQPVSTPEWRRPWAGREPRRWVETAEQAKPVLAAAAMAAVVSGREGDVCPLWGRIPAPGWHVLGRARADLRLGTVDIRRSPNEKDRSLAKAVRLTLIEVCEADPPAVARPHAQAHDAEPIHWRPLATHGAATAETGLAGRRLASGALVHWATVPPPEIAGPAA